MSGATTSDESRSGTWERRLWWLHSIWALSVGVFVVVYAADSFQRARFLILTLVAAWLLILLFYRLFGAEPTGPADRSLGSKAGYWVFTYLLKNLYQVMLFFLLPFYWKSATIGTPNQWFVVALALVAVVATLDLVFDNILMTRRWLATTYFSLVLFAALNLAIPALLPGLDPRWSLLGAAGVSVIGLSSFHPRLSEITRTPFGLGLVIVVAVALGLLVTPAVPPVPHYLVEGSVGTDLVDGEPRVRIQGIHASRLPGVQAETRVLAPGGDATLWHVWRRDGAVVHTEEKPRHSHEDGICTSRSILPRQKVPAAAAGRWSVDVETVDRRLIGRVRFRVFESVDLLDERGN